MEQLFNTLTFMIWDSRHDGKLRGSDVLVKHTRDHTHTRQDLWNNSNFRITKIFFSCHCCLISNARSLYLHCLYVTVDCGFWENGIIMFIYFIIIIIITITIIAIITSTDS